MVPLIQNKKEEILNSHNLESAFLHNWLGLSMDSFDEKTFAGHNLTAFKGYLNDNEELKSIENVINRAPVKGIDYSNNIYCFIGVHLASPQKFNDKITEKFNSFSLKNMFAISLFFNEYEKTLCDVLKNAKDDEYYPLLNLLFEDDVFSDDDEKLVFNSLINNPSVDAIDVILYEKLLKKFTSFKFNGLSAVEFIKNIFSNFQDSIKHITNNRRKDHDLFEINDEYDVQDLSYLILRSIFPTLEFENPHFKCGGTSSRVDLMLEEEGIDIELKMIKINDKDEKEFIKQLKIDFNDYSTWKNLKDLIVFVYDPYNKTTNRTNFYSLNGHKSINNTNFNVHIIVSN